MGYLQEKNVIENNRHDIPMINDVFVFPLLSISQRVLLFGVYPFYC